MKKGITLFICILFLTSGYGQQSLKDIRRNGRISIVYRISSDTAAKYLSAGLKDVDHFLQQVPFIQFNSDSIQKLQLPIGNYILLSVVDNELVAEYYCRTKTKVFTINNQHRVQLAVLDDAGKNMPDATVMVNRNTAIYSVKSETYQLDQRKPEEAIVKVMRPGDTSFFQLTGLNKIRYSPGKQKWMRFKSTKPGKLLTWLPNRIHRMIKNKPRYWFPKKYKGNQRGKGYVIFNKPKYLPADTIKFKAYLLDKKGKQYKKEVFVSLSYTKANKYISNDLVSLKPVSPGAYVYEFVVGDSLPLDTRINLHFETNKKITLHSENFTVEDYLLDEVSSYNIRSQKDVYYHSDSILFFTSAKDVNGLSVMDGRVKLLLLNTGVEKFYPDRVFVPDTLWQEEKTLLIDEETKFNIPSYNFPEADFKLKAVALFRNSNNEIQQKEATVQFNASGKSIMVTEDEGFISAVYFEKGKLVTASGWMDHNLVHMPLLIQFPYKAKISPQIDSYDFYMMNEAGKKTVFTSFAATDQYIVSFSHLQIKDSAGFRLYNPKRVPVYFTLFDGNKIIERKTDSSIWISRIDKINKGRTFRLKWQYYWAGEEKVFEEDVALLSKMMGAEINGAATVYPGQTDTITIKMKDYLGRSLNNVNLTVASYNAQFSSDIDVPDPPYIEKFRSNLNVRYDAYEAEPAFYKHKFLLGDHQQWRKNFALDTMPFYKFLFPEKGYHLVRTRIEDPVPQVSVHVVKKGVLQEIYMLNINRQPVYYNGATSQPLYSYTVFPGYAQFGIRLQDWFIETDSIYMQPFYKHDIAFDLDNLPAKAKQIPMEKEWSTTEKNLLNERMLQIENNYRNNYGYLWQNEKVIFLDGSPEHVIGPFRPYDTIQFFKPRDFDFSFQFEPGYRYRVSPGMVRLERMQLFKPLQKAILSDKAAKWKLGDTILRHPVISYSVISRSQPFLDFTGYNYNSAAGLSKILLVPIKDSMIVFTILHTADSAKNYRVLGGGVRELAGLSPGSYTVLLVTQNLNIAEEASIEVKTAGTYCLRFENTPLSRSNPFIQMLQRRSEEKRLAEELKTIGQLRKNAALDTLLYDQLTTAPNYSYGSRTITGSVVDEKGGSPIPFAAVTLKGTRFGTTTDAQGNFVLRNVPENAILVISSIGYSNNEIHLAYRDNLTISMSVLDGQSLSEVVVTSYGLTRAKKSLSYSVSSVKAMDITSQLSGKVAGVSVSMTPGSAQFLKIRGTSSINSDNKPLYIVNGVPMDEMPADLDSSILSMTVLKDNAAVQLYGARAVNGVIVITTKNFNPKSLRDQFRDYAFWKPNLFTNNDGEVKFPVTYPDNITSWQTWVVGMDKKRRIAKTSFTAKAFKPLLAQLSAPQFLIDGDTAVLIGKIINYTSAKAEVKTSFSISEKIISQKEKEVPANNSSIDELNLSALNTDTISTQFSLMATSGFSDGEKRKIPVYRKGIEEAIGKFWVFGNDTAVSFLPDNNAGEVHLYAQNNALDVLLNEINELKKYPYYCMEQIASKLKGLLAERKIRESLKQSFTGEKEVGKLLDKLLKAQLYDGGWSWWQGGDPNLSITNYVIRSLLPLRKNPQVEIAVRNGLLYLQNNLASYKREVMLSALYTMSESGHFMEYKQHLSKIPFDSMTVHQQWQIIKIKQQQKMDYTADLELLMNKKAETMLGGLYWGDDNYYWDENYMATTALAFSVLVNEEKSQTKLNSIIQYFLEKRSSGRWRNTVESAVTLETILPIILKTQSDFNDNAKLSINGEATVKFPFLQTIDNGGKAIAISKSGGGLLYLTVWQKIFNDHPEPVTDKFRINTWFEKNGRQALQLEAGELVTMKVKVEVLKDADYVQIEIPIPAGCTYSEKKQEMRRSHKEFYKNKLVIFIEKMSKGVFDFEIELEPRYAGNYQLNPAKAELMYFPVFYGRNEMKKVKITR